MIEFLRMISLKPHTCIALAYVTFVNANQNAQSYLSIEMLDGMGIGNQMFIYAAMYGLAKINNKTAIVRAEHTYPIKEYFALSVPQVSTTHLNFTKVIVK
jgi:hypothetical protein